MSVELPLAAPSAKESLVHPCDVVQRSNVELRQRLHRMRVTHGWAAAARTSMVEATLLSTGRMGGLPTSHALYHSYVGNFDDIDVQDVYGLPENSPFVQKAPRTLFHQQFYGEEPSVVSMMK